jgi:hypothetical protein
MSEMHLYEISNPSDPYTMECTDDLIAGVATLFLGDGKYMLKTVDRPQPEKPLVPLLIFGGEEALQQWCDEHGIGAVSGLSDWAIDHAEAIATALDSVAIGSVEERRSFEKVLACISSDEERAKARNVHHDEKRSSMNDIGRRAKALAKALRTRAMERNAQHEGQHTGP